MRTTLSESFAERDGGRFKERPIVVEAESLMNAQALFDDVRKFHARQARLLRAFAAESERIAGAITTTLVRLAQDVRTTELAHKERKP